MTTEARREEQAAEVYWPGFWRGMSVAALVLSFVTYLSLLGFEKAILAIALGALTVRGAARGGAAWRAGLAAVILGAVFIIMAAVMLIVMRERLAEFITLLQKLS